MSVHYTCILKISKELYKMIKCGALLHKQHDYKKLSTLVQLFLSINWSLNLGSTVTLLFAVAPFKELYAFKCQYFMIPNVHYNNKLTYIKQPLALKGHSYFVSWLDWLPKASWLYYLQTHLNNPNGREYYSTWKAVSGCTSI